MLYGKEEQLAESQVCMEGKTADSTVLCCTPLNRPLQHCTALHCIMLYFTVLCCTALHIIAVHITALQTIAVHITALHITAVHITALNSGQVTAVSEESPNMQVLLAVGGRTGMYSRLAVRIMQLLSTFVFSVFSLSFSLPAG